jgi:Rieske Fe-S protein
MAPPAQSGTSAPGSPHRAGGPSDSTNRRNWIVEWAAIVCGGLVGIVPAAIGLASLLDPLRRRSAVPKAHQQGASAKEGFIRVAPLDGLTVGGPPQRFPVIADQVDAWNFTPDQPVGAVFLQRVAENEVRCFNATCPHAGCSVSVEGQAFACPCHNSAFNLDGTKSTSSSGRENPSPRGMDSLEVDADKLAENEVWVRFVNFYTGQHEKIPKT